MGVTPATLARYWWFNMIQEEIMSVITAGGVTPDTAATNFTQLLAALRNITGAGNRSQLFTANGTFTTDAYTSLVWLTGTAGGAAGGGASTVSGGRLFSGGGGGAGDFVWRRSLVVAPSTAYAITIAGTPSGGAVNTTAGGVAATGSGGAVTSFGALFSLAGGLGGHGGDDNIGQPGSGGVGGSGSGLGGDPGLVGDGMSTPAVTNGSVAAGRGGVSMFGKYGKGGEGGEGGYASGTTPLPLPGKSGGPGILMVEF